MWIMEIVKMDVKDAFNAVRPEKFVIGSPGTSVNYHTKVCPRVKAGLKLHKPLHNGGNRVSGVGENTIEFHELEQCPECQKIEEEQ